MTIVNAKRFLKSNSGQSLIETALSLSLLLVILAAAIDFGRAYYLLVELKSAAHAGAVYGSQYPTDVTGMNTAAASNATDLANNSFTKTASWGCECDSSQATTAGTNSCTTTPSCTGGNLVYYVTVTTGATYSPLLPWPGIPSTMTLSETVQMRSTNY